jgi:hypothetical protein
MPCSRDDLRRLAEALLEPRHFHGDWPLAFRHEPAERLRWEVFQGRLLDESHTREERTFESWNVHHIGDSGTSPEPVLSLKLDAEARVLHVVRGVESYVREGYGSGGGVYLSRERRKWLRELVATLPLADEELLRDEAESALARAVTGTRLPLTPVEAPLPAFSFGRLWYDPRAAHAVSGGEEAAYCVRGSWEARALEFQLRSRPFEEVAAACSAGVLGTLRRVFRDVSLSPYTDFVDRVLRLLALLEQGAVLRPDEVLDFEGGLLRLVARHLTAYDLVTFHHRGANYPDTLLLDAVLADYLTRLERSPERFAGEAGRLRRRALRQAYLLRRECEGLPVPDVPTSPGEHARVYPDAYPRVPEEQVLQTARRRRRLYAGDPLRLSATAAEVLAESVRDLRQPDEAQELGAAVYLDRPFGGAKALVEPDGTPLLASLAYSRSIASRRLRQLGESGGAPELPGVALERIGGPVRQATLSLSDAARAAGDFVFRRTLPGSVEVLAGLFDFGPFADRLRGAVLVARSPGGPGLAVYDEAWRPRLEFEPCLERGYASRRGVEWPAAGVRVTRIDGEALAESAPLPAAPRTGR